MVELKTLTTQMDQHECQQQKLKKSIQDTETKKHSVQALLVDKKIQLEAINAKLENVIEIIRAVESESWDLQTQMASTSTGLLQGVIHLQQIHGRDKIPGLLCNLVKVDKTNIESVNAVLKRHLSVVLVKSRAIGLKVAEYFTAKKLGRITCCIWSEVDSQCNCTQSKSLCKLLVCDDSQRGVFHRYCHSWTVVDNCNDALTALTSNAGNNYVTRNGELFMSDGEIRTFGKQKKYDNFRVQYIGEVNSTGHTFNRSEKKIQELGKLMKNQMANRRELEEEQQKVTLYLL